MSATSLPYFDLTDGIYIVTGGGRGLGLTLATAIVEAGGQGKLISHSVSNTFIDITSVYCLDRLESPHDDFYEVARRRYKDRNSPSIHYEHVDVTKTEHLNAVVAKIADEHQRLDGLIASAGVQQITPALEYSVKDLEYMMSVNYTGVFMAATAVARQMFKYKCRGSICLIASMSGLIANKGLITSVYNSSKAAVTQLARNLAMEWGKIDESGGGALRVNSLSPGHIVTPMVQKNFEEVPELKEIWQRENMMGRLSSPEEYKGAAIFLLSKASSFMTGSNLVIDGGHTAW